MRLPGLLVLLTTLLLAGGGAFAQTGDKAGARQLVRTPVELVGVEEATANASVLPAHGQIRWEVYAPATARSGEPPGVLVYISPTISGRPPAEWLEVMNEQNLIWVGANQSGNDVATVARIMMAVLGLRAIDQEYAIDPERVYLSGFSGGGRTASLAMGKFPELFRGAIYICGVNFWEDADEEALERIRANAYVFLTGTRDFNQAGTARVYRQYKDAGVERALAMVITGLGHALPSPPDLSKAIDFLDERAAGVEE